MTARIKGYRAELVVLKSSEAINESLARVASALNQSEAPDWTMVLRGHLLVLPFPIVAPPGSHVEGPRDALERLHG